MDPLPPNCCRLLLLLLLLLYYCCRHQEYPVLYYLVVVQLCDAVMMSYSCIYVCSSGIFCVWYYTRETRTLLAFAVDGRISMNRHFVINY